MIKGNLKSFWNEYDCGSPVTYEAMPIDTRMIGTVDSSVILVI